MNYPLISEYIEAIKAAEDNFEELTNLRVVLGDDGQPVMTSGNFAVVFKMQDINTGKLYALKCFTKEQEGRAEAYHQIADALKDVDSPYLVSLRYLDKELFVDTEQTAETEFPVLLMDWVEGKTLDKYLRENLDDKYALEMLAYRFSQLAQWIIPQSFAHGDLKPDNILVREDGTLVLVDYDGMYVPAMKGQKARELGSPDFRHPLRTENDFDEHIDDFPVASILLSIKAISLDSNLLDRFGAVDRLLFSATDYYNISACLSLDAIKLLLSNKGLEWLYSLFFIAHIDQNFTIVPDFPRYVLLPDNHSISFFPESFIILNDSNVDEECKKKLLFNVEKSAKLGNIEAILHLAWCIEHGRGMCENKEAANNWYTKAALLGNARAQYHLGVTCKNKKDSIDWLELSASHNSIAALKRLAMYYYRGINVEQNFDKAFECYKKLEEIGSENVKYHLGFLYLNGQGVCKDYLKAYCMFSKVVKRHRDYAILCMGYCCEKGFGVQQNYNNAVSFYSKIGDGFAEVAVRLGLLYSKGLGVEQNDKIAFEYFCKAHKLSYDDPIPKLCIGICYENGIGVSKDENKALEWYDYINATEQIIIEKHGTNCLLESKSLSQWKKDALNNNMISQRHIGHCYFYGIGVNDDDDKASEWYEKAANNGDSESFCFLWLSTLTKCDKVEAIRLLSKAANQNNPEGKSLLADFYSGGWGVPADGKRALQLYFEAAMSGEIKAMCNLGYCYAYGIGIERDMEKATEWYSRYVNHWNEESIKWLTTVPMTI